MVGVDQMRAFRHPHYFIFGHARPAAGVSAPNKPEGGSASTPPTHQLIQGQGHHTPIALISVS